ncbi:hypothetical protein Scep_002245 [Stephania cephalantha]|uniref:Uncharacterized protein n=1 Tax=Stephania cephalantha TaxID=152367 RepID=A0AAP0LDL1_9MAGN
MLLGETLSNRDLTLCFSMDPSTLLFLLKRNLHLMGLHPGGRSTSSQVLFPIIESISSFNASFQKAASLSFIASSTV